MNFCDGAARWCPVRAGEIIQLRQIYLKEYTVEVFKLLCPNITTFVQ